MSETEATKSGFKFTYEGFETALMFVSGDPFPVDNGCLTLDYFQSVTLGVLSVGARVKLNDRQLASVLVSRNNLDVFSVCFGDDTRVIPTNDPEDESYEDVIVRILEYVLNESTAEVTPSPSNLDKLQNITRTLNLTLKDIESLGPEICATPMCERLRELVSEAVVFFNDLALAGGSDAPT